MREFTPLAILLGILIGIVFGAANAFVGLQVGMTISASIPAAVISMGVMRGLLKRGTLLENNMVQTVGSAGESLAAGMIFTIPALFIMGFEPKYLELVIWGGIGGLMGVLFMVPLRRALIVKEHERLRYPEGRACAEVLEAGQRGGAGAKIVFWGLGAGALFELFRGLGCWGKKALVSIPQLHTEARLGVSPALLGVGYILGPRVAGYMLGGAVLGWFVIIPAIALFGGDATEPVAPASQLIRDMDPEAMWEQYLRYIGAGAVILGGLISLIKSAPTIGSSIWHAAGALFRRRGRSDRTQRDLPLPLLILGLVGLWALMWYVPQIKVGHAGAIAVLVFGFFFVTVSSRLVGIVGSSSNPVSGMTIAALLGTTLIFTYVLKQTDETAKYAAISVGALVCIALCIAGDCSQDLKTGYLVKATPWKQQIGEIIGVLTSAVALAGVLWLLHRSYGFERNAEHPNALLAPQANIMKVLVEGVMGGNLPWVLIFTGMGAALVVELLGLGALPFAVGLYLPLELSTPIMVGGIVRWLVVRIRRRRTEGDDPGILGASGLVAGYGLIGIAFAGAAYGIARIWNNPLFANPLSGEEGSVVPEHLVPWLMNRGTVPLRFGLSEFGFDLLPAAPFALMVVWLLVTALRRPPAPPPAPARSFEPPTPPPPAALEPSSAPEAPLTESRYELAPAKPAPTSPDTTADQAAEAPSEQPPEDDEPDTWYAGGEQAPPHTAPHERAEPAAPAEDVETEEPQPDQDKNGGTDRWPPPSPFPGE